MKEFSLKPVTVLVPNLLKGLKVGLRKRLIETPEIQPLCLTIIT